MLKLCRVKSSIRLLLTAVPRQIIWNSCASYDSPRIKMKIVPVAPIITKTYKDKNEDLKRALSPHLTIYKPQLTSLMSISLRMTGLALAIIIWTVFLMRFAFQQNVDGIVEILKSLELDDCMWTSFKTIVAFPFAFHFVAGIRHLMFDTSKLLEKSHFYTTAYAAILVALGLAIFLGLIETADEEDDEMDDEEDLNTSFSD